MSRALQGSSCAAAGEEAVGGEEGAGDLEPYEAVDEAYGGFAVDVLVRAWVPANGRIGTETSGDSRTAHRRLRATEKGRR